jgi:DNA (cytosine-5)-methyltransferase 1
MSLGFEQAGFDVAAAVDFDPIHTRTHSTNFPRCKSICADIAELSGRQIRSLAGLGNKQLHVLFGGPPCQGFSLIGKRRSDDPRNLLLYEFARLLRELRPVYFVLENVAGLLLGDAAKVLDSFLCQSKKAGYVVAEPIQLLDASDFGVPQRRRRAFVLGCRKGFALPAYPIPRFHNVSSNGRTGPTVRDAINDLPNIDDHSELLENDVFHGSLGPPTPYAKLLRHPLVSSSRRHDSQSMNGGLSGCLRTVHSHETIRRFTATAPGTFEPVSRFYRLASNGLAPTLRAGTGRSHGSFTAPRPIHPIHSRCISVREAARLHSFPDWFAFNPTKWHGFRQVGNSVPPFVALAVAEVIRELIADG